MAHSKKSFNGLIRIDERETYEERDREQKKIANVEIGIFLLCKRHINFDKIAVSTLYICVIAFCNNCYGKFQSPDTGLSEQIHTYTNTTRHHYTLELHTE